MNPAVKSPLLRLLLLREGKGTALKQILRCSLGIVMSMFAAHMAMADLSDTDMFNERPNVRGFDAESRIDAVKRERLETQRASIANQRKNYSNQMRAFCACVSPTFDCKYDALMLFRYDPKKSWEENKAWERKVLKDRSIKSRNRRKIAEQCEGWEKNGVNDESTRQFERKLQAMDAQVQKELDVEKRLHEQRVIKIKADQAQRRAEQDDLHLKLKNQRDTVNDANRIKYLESKRKTDAALDRQREWCRIQLAQGQYPCGCPTPNTGGPKKNTGTSCSK